MSWWGRVVVAGIVVALVAVVSSVPGSSSGATDPGVGELAEQLTERAAHVHALGQLNTRPWLTRLGAGGLGAAVALVVSSTVVFLYYDRTMQ